MRIFISWVLLLTLLGASVYQWFAHGAQYRAIGRTVRQNAFPCSSPVSYSVGAIDLRYDLSVAELTEYLKEAEAVWESAYKRDLFEFIPSSGDVSVNMLYDRRQAAIDKLKAIGLKTGQSLDFYKSLKVHYDEVLGRVEPRQAGLNARLAAYKRGEAVYNATVAKFNQRGTASPRQIKRLDGAKAALEREFAVIKNIEGGVNADIDLLNALATTLNQLIVELDINTAQYNREGAALGTFEEGTYRVSGGFRTIDLYKYSDRRQLVRLLTHEMGHALGMDHVLNPEAMMFPVNRGDALTIFPDDIHELDRVCAPLLKKLRRRAFRG
ncbi:MAG TPA: hypothetical protein DEQ38_13160 [Elusimicrobia bacterium]|nr:MAG: hypothetical protein A2089_14305 [Elusimicrobia bacterium GWD2_63_28]HCC49046.1 hypothetical protein [Elusimicrobiota bacterium]